MSKFNVTVEIDYIDEDGNLDDAICEQIVDAVVAKVSTSVSKEIEDKAKKKLDTSLVSMGNEISEKLNAMMEEFFNTPKDITDRWGDIKRRNVSIKDLLKEACDNFMTQPLDRNGNPAANSYDQKYSTRVDYIVAKSIDVQMENAIKRAVCDVTDNLKKKVSDEIKKQMGEKLAGIVELDKLIGK